MWIGSQNGLIRFDGSHTRIYRYNLQNAQSLLGNIGNQLVVDSAGRLWETTDLGLNFYDDSVDAFQQIQLKGLDGVSYFTDVYDVEVTVNNDLLILSNENIYLFTEPMDFATFNFVATENNFVKLAGGRDLFVDSDQVIWVATDGDGVVFLDNSLFRVKGGFYKKIEASLKGMGITRIFQDSRRRI